MPHIHLQTTSDLEENANLPDILEALTSALAAQESIPSASIRAFHTLRSVWQMGEGAPEGFAHCEVAILEGRSLELRKKIAQAVIQVMREEFAESLAAGQAGVSVEVRQMERETYER